MRKQQFLQALKRKLEIWYLNYKESEDPKVEWTPETRLELCVLIDGFVRKNNDIYHNILAKMTAEELVISESTMQRILNSGEMNKHGLVFEEYNVEEPIRRPKRQNLNVLCQFLGVEHWNRFINTHLKNEQVREELVREYNSIINQEFDAFKNGKLNAWIKHDIGSGKHLYEKVYNGCLNSVLITLQTLDEIGLTVQTPQNTSTINVSKIMGDIPDDANNLKPLQVWINCKFYCAILGHMPYVCQYQREFGIIDRVIVTTGIFRKSKNKKWNFEPHKYNPLELWSIPLKMANPSFGPKKLGIKKLSEQKMDENL